MIAKIDPSAGEGCDGVIIAVGRTVVPPLLFSPFFLFFFLLFCLSPFSLFDPLQPRPQTERYPTKVECLYLAHREVIISTSIIRPSGPENRLNRTVKL